MKTIKFFSFAMLLSLAWVSCKDANTASTETATAEVVGDSVFVAAKTDAAANMEGLKNGVIAKITELEAGIASAADDAAKATLTAQLETYKKFQADLEAAAVKVAQATPETWATVIAEVDAVHYAVKTSLTSFDGKTDQISK